MLVIESLCKRYLDAGVRHQILDHAEFKLDDGASLSIVGASGSGKSTLLHLIGALDSADSGRILIKNTPKDHYDDICQFTERQADRYRKRDLGLIFQKFNLIDCITVYDNVCLPAKLNNNLDLAYIQDLLQKLGIEQLQHKLPSDLSGGEQQRVAIARALSHRPKLVLADEPTGNLDALNSDKVSRLLVDTCKLFGASLIMVTHSETVAQLTEHQAELKEGKLQTIKKRAALKLVE